MGTIIRSILDRQESTFFYLHDFFGSLRDVYFQLEGWHPASSVKWKPARYMIEGLGVQDSQSPVCSKLLEG
jgi:cysteine synthase